MIGSEVDSPRFRPNALELAAMPQLPICRRLEKTGWKWSCLVLLCAAVHGAAQITPADGSPSPKLIPRTKAERDAQYAFHHRILLNVQVTDSSGHAVTGLNASNFTLQISNKPQPITSFQAIEDGGTTAHAHAFFLIDMLNNSARDLAKAQKAINALGGRSLPLPTSLVVLNERGTEVRSPSRNAEELAAELAQVTKGFHQSECTEDWNNAALGKAVATMGSLSDINRSKSREEIAERISDCLNRKYQLSFTSLLGFAHHQQDVPGRAILIWIGPGWPILSGSDFSSETPYARESFFANLVNASTELREGQVTLHAVSWPALSPISKLNYSELDIVRSISMAAQASARSVAMPVLAHHSGGQVYLREKNLTPELATCLADANSYYVLGFDSAPSAIPNEFREIRVIIDKPAVTVRTNTEYYAQP